MGSDESHFDVSVGSDGQTHKIVSTNHNLFEEKGEPKRYRTEVLPLTQPNALPLGQTGSPSCCCLLLAFIQRCSQLSSRHTALFSVGDVGFFASIDLSIFLSSSQACNCCWRCSCVLAVAAWCCRLLLI